MQALLAAIAESRRFKILVTCAICLAGALAGIETYPALAARYRVLLEALDGIVLAVFVVEIIARIGACGRRPWRFFADPWNVFDFVVVAACFAPQLGQYAMAIRLVRLLRVLRLIRAVPRLQIIVGALIRSLPSMVYVGLLLGLLFYVYAVAATVLFGRNDPLHFANLHTALLSLFRIVTLEDWTDIMYIQMYGCGGYEYPAGMCVDSDPSPVLGALFFVSFVVIGTMVTLNLFIGVIVGSMDAATKEREREEAIARRREAPGLDRELEEVARQLAGLQETIAGLRARLPGPAASAVDPTAPDPYRATG